MAVDFKTAVGKVRALIPDVEEIPNSNRPGDAPEYLFSDDHLGVFLDTVGATPTDPNDSLTYVSTGAQNFWAAALACDAIGGSEALISKVITTEDLATDGAKLGNYWTNRAKWLRQQAAQLESDEFDGFEIVPFYPRPVHWEPR